MSETNITSRQNLILTLINQSSTISRVEIEKKVVHKYPSSKPTIARDLAMLVQKKLIKVSGKGKSTRYLPKNSNPLLRYIDPKQYFTLEVDERPDAATSFDFTLFGHLHNLFSKEEVAGIDKINKSFTKETQKLTKDIYRKELERFVIELSWKSSRIEGNTYSLLDTETLIKQSIEASGHPRQEAVMILNHKAAFETILSHKNEFKKITLSQIIQLHNVLVKGLSITAGIRNGPVGIIGTTYRPLDNSFQIKEVLEKVIGAINLSIFPLEKALIAIVFISYIQAFADGNKRTGRMLANAILLAADFYPLSYRSVDETTFKEALILFYEQHSLVNFKKILLDQYRFALETYFN